MRLFQKRVHESVAFSALLAVSLALHVAWVANVFVYRSESVASWMTFNSSIGPVSGLYSLSLLIFFSVFIAAFLIVRGRDLSELRDRVFWFFVGAIFLFLLMTMPIVFQIGIDIV